jgi:hypothetical protein
MPLVGSFTGAAGAYLGMQVQVQVRKLGDLAELRMDEAIVQAAGWLARRLVARA